MNILDSVSLLTTVLTTENNNHQLKTLAADSELFQDFLGQFMQPSTEDQAPFIEDELTIDVDTAEILFEEPAEDIEEMLEEAKKVMLTFQHVRNDAPREGLQVSNNSQLQTITSHNQPTMLFMKKDISDKQAMIASESLEAEILTSFEGDGFEKAVSPEVIKEVAVAENMIQPRDIKPTKETAVSELKLLPQEEREFKVLEPAEAKIEDKVEQVKLSHPIDQMSLDSEVEPVTEDFFKVDGKQVGMKEQLVTTDKPLVAEAVQVQQLEQAPINPALREGTPLSTPSTTEISFHSPQQFVRDVGALMDLSIQDMTTQESKQIRVSLTPETLGNIEIQLEWKDDKVLAKLMVQKDEVKTFLETKMPLLLSETKNETVIQSIVIEELPQANLHFSGQQMDFNSHQQAEKHHPTNYSNQSTMVEEEAEEEVTTSTDGLSLYI